MALQTIKFDDMFNYLTQQNGHCIYKSTKSTEI